MAIKEYALKEICNFKTGIDPLSNEKCGNIPFIKLGDTNNHEINYDNAEKIKTSRKNVTKVGDLLLCWSCSVGKSFIVRNKCFYSTAFYKLESKSNVYINKYLHYFFIKNENIINKLAVGTVLKKANMNILGNYVINLPDIQIQQSIINIIEPKEQLFLKYHEVVDISDLNKFQQSWSNLINIIEPFEKILNTLNLKINVIYNFILLSQYTIKKLGYMKDNDIFFEKGKTINSRILTTNISRLLFINVSAINNNFNKWIIDESIKNNINYGDVILSLDGTTGLVNNFLKGFNGYGYKVWSNKIPNYQIYYSLLNPINKNIINECSQGSVIKHASTAKKHLYLYEFDKKIYEFLYRYEINLKKIKMLINKIINNLIYLFVI